MTLTHSPVSENTAGYDGGGILAVGGAMFPGSAVLVVQGTAAARPSIQPHGAQRWRTRPS